MTARLILGDCLEKMAEIADGSVDMVLSDLPYNEVSQESGGLRLLDRGAADRCDFNLEKAVEEFDRLCSGSFYLFCGTQQISPLVTAFRKRGMTTRVGAWDKTNPSPMNGSRLWVSGLEFCVFARKAKATFNEHCKKALWQAPSGRSKQHPTEKPLSLMERLVLASTKTEDVVLDATMGSGTTGVACVRTGRAFIGIERDSTYFKIAENRIINAQEQNTLFDDRGVSGKARSVIAGLTKG